MVCNAQVSLQANKTTGGNGCPNCGDAEPVDIGLDDTPSWGAELFFFGVFLLCLLAWWGFK